MQEDTQQLKQNQQIQQGNIQNLPVNQNYQLLQYEYKPNADKKSSTIDDIPQLKCKYVLKCIEGVYKGRFLFLTMHETGEIFGSGDIEQNKLTMQIEGANISAIHTKICINGPHFEVSDLGSETGTWIQLPDNGLEIITYPLYLNYQDQVIKISQGSLLDQVEQFCDMVSNVQLTEHFYSANLNNLQDIKASIQADQSELQNVPGLSVTPHELLDQLNALDITKYTKRGLIYEIIDQEKSDIQFELGWKGAIIKLTSSSKLMVSQPENIKSVNFKELCTTNNQIAYVKREKQCYKVCPCQCAKEHMKIFRKLQENEKYPLQLKDQIKIGSLVFQFNRYITGQGTNICHRKQMEDFITVKENLRISEKKICNGFMVADGHGGWECAKYVAENILNLLEKELIQLNLDETKNLDVQISKAVQKCFFQVDLDFYNSVQQKISKVCGATAALILIIGSRVYIFWVGDCRAFLLQRQQIFRLTSDHLPHRQDELNRITKLGGNVTQNRLQGKVTISRAFGQFEYKSIDDYQNLNEINNSSLKSLLSVNPQMNIYELTNNNDDFLFLSTDGIYEAFTEQEICNFILQKSLDLEIDQSPEKIVSELQQAAMQTNKCSDNMGSILIFINKRQKEELQ